MKSWIVVATVALLSVGAASLASFKDEKPDTSTIMKGLFGKKAGKFNTLKTQVGAAKTDWDAIQKNTKEITKLGEALDEAEPEKGDKESWKKLAGKFGENTKALNDAAEAKDLDKVKASQKTIGGSCKSCHDLHKGQ